MEPVGRRAADPACRQPVFKLQYQMGEDGTVALLVAPVMPTTAVDALLRRFSAEDAPGSRHRRDGPRRTAPYGLFAAIQRTRQRRAAVLEGQDRTTSRSCETILTFERWWVAAFACGRGLRCRVRLASGDVASTGGCEISLEEAALMIQGIATAKRWRFPAR